MNRTPRLILSLLALLACCLPLKSAQAQTYSVDAMIGQVNGRAIYTRDVLDEQLCQTLANWGKELPLSEFRQRATERIVLRLNAMVTDALVLGEAQRDLSDRQRQSLTVAVSRQRETLLREFGQGSPALAEAELIKQTGFGLDQTLKQWRQAVIVKRYMRQKLQPKINVTRKDIKRYYYDHQDDYNPPPSRTIHVIQTNPGEEAETVTEMLDRGTPFPEVAEDPRNSFHHDTQGLMGDMVGQQLFADENVNKAAVTLEPGQYAGPFTVGDKQWFVYVDRINEQPGKTLMDVQTEIQNMLFEQQYREQTERYRKELIERGNFNSIEQMAQTLVQIAEDRYARAQPKPQP